MNYRYTCTSSQILFSARNGIQYQFCKTKKARRNKLGLPCSSHVSSLIPRGSGGSGARTRLDDRRPVGRDGGTGGELPTGGWGAGKEGTPGPSCNKHINKGICHS